MVSFDAFVSVSVLLHPSLYAYVRGVFPVTKARESQRIGANCECRRCGTGVECEQHRPEMIARCVVQRQQKQRAAGVISLSVPVPLLQIICETRERCRRRCANSAEGSGRAEADHGACALMQGARRGGARAVDEVESA